MVLKALKRDKHPRFRSREEHSLASDPMRRFCGLTEVRILSVNVSIFRERAALPGHFAWYAMLATAHGMMWHSRSWVFPKWIGIMMLFMTRCLSRSNTPKCWQTNEPAGKRTLSVSLFYVAFHRFPE